MLFEYAIEDEKVSYEHCLDGKELYGKMVRKSRRKSNGGITAGEFINLDDMGLHVSNGSRISTECNRINCSMRNETRQHQKS